MELEKITKEIEEIAIDFAYDRYCRDHKIADADPGLKGYISRYVQDEWMKLGNFADDEEKMRDFRELTKAQFLESYSYLTEEEYDNTMKIEMESCYDEIGRCIDHLDKLHHCLFSYDMNEKDEDRCDGFECCIEDLENGMCQLLYGEE